MGEARWTKLWTTDDGRMVSERGDVILAVDSLHDLYEALVEFSWLYGHLWDVVEPNGAGFLSAESVAKYDAIHTKARAALAAARGEDA